MPDRPTRARAQPLRARPIRADLDGPNGQAVDGATPVAVTAGHATGGEVVQAGERRSARVESLRAVAALAVLVSHAWLYARRFGPETTDTWLHRSITGGGLGVQLFFALSGFLIYRPFARRDFATGPAIDLRNYARNRAVRILPLYWAAVAILLIFTEGGGSFSQWWRFTLFAESFSTSTAQTVDPPMWSVIVELHFYLLLPLLAWGIAAVCRQRRLLAVGALLALAVPSIVMRRVDPDPAVIWQYSLPATFFGFVPGMVLAILDIEWSEKRPRWLRGAVASTDVWLVAAAATWALIFWDFDLAVPVTALAAFLTVGAVVLPLRPGPLVRVLDWRPLALVGVASYSLYIWHVPVIEELADKDWIGTSFARMLLVALVLSLLAAAVSYAVVERPALRLRRGWLAPRSGRGTPAAREPDVASSRPPVATRLSTWTTDQRWVAAAVVVGFLARARTVMATRHLALGNDPADYDRLGRLFADGEIFGVSLLSPSGGPTAFRPPLYPAFLGIVYWLTGDSIVAARMVQAALGAATVVLIWLVARRLFGRRTALVAAAMAALYPPLVFATVALMSESILIPLMLGGFLAALHARDGGARASLWSAVAGVCFGLGVLARPNSAVLVVPLVLLVLGWRRAGVEWRSGTRRAGVLVATAALTVLPWEIRNLVELDTFVPVSTIDGYNIAGVYNDDAATAAYPDRYHFRPPNGVAALAPLFTDPSLDEVSLGTDLRSEGLEFLAEHPTAPLEAEFWNSYRMLELPGLDLSAAVAAQSGYGRQTATVGMVSFWMLAALAAASVALATLRRAPPALWLAPVLLWLGTALFLGDARLRAPIDVFLLLPGAVTATWLVDRAASLVRRAAPPDPATSLDAGAGAFRLGFRPALEGLRGVAVVLVVVFHVVTFLTPEVYGRGWFEGSFIGVDMFFVLSGFLITSLLLEEFRRSGAISLGAFYLRRAARLLPAVLTLLAVTTVYVIATGLDIATHTRTVTMVLTYSANWLFGRNAEISDGFGHMWSLAIEEQFYLLWPLALVGLLRAADRDLRRVFAVAVAGIGAAALLRASLYESSGIWSRVYFRTDARADELLWGVALAVALHAGWVRARANTVVAAISGATIAWLAWTMNLFAGFYYDIGASLVAVATVALVVTSLDASGAPGRLLSVRALRAFGRISYALYLWHVPVIVAVQRYLGDAATWLQIALSVLVSIALATLSTRLVERPFIQLKARWEKVPKQAPAVADTAEPLHPTVATAASVVAR